MAISLLEVKSLEKHPSNTDLLIRSLQTVSLDAFVPFHSFARVPQHFADEHRLFLQRELHDYYVPVGAKTSHSAAWALRVLQAYELQFGRGRTELLIEWMSHCDSVPMFGYIVQSRFNDFRESMAATDIPARLLRFEALRELLTEYDEDALDAALLPQNLRSDGDKHCWASNYWPEEEQNTWNPAISVWAYISGSGTHLAWENACRNPRVTTKELDELHAWVLSNARNAPADLPRPETMFLPARLRAEYEDRGLTEADT